MPATSVTRSNLPIAIIGVAGRFPDAENVDEFFANLERGRVSLGRISPERIAGTALEPAARFRTMGYLENIDRFDYELFGMSLGEARTLSPIARVLLQEAWRAFESSGCSPDRFRGSRTDVYMTQFDSTYPELAEDGCSTLFTGNSPDFVVARLNREFDLRGNALVVDASCASGVAAVLMACDSLRLDRAEYAIVCGANLHLLPYEQTSLLETWSPTGRCHSYAADANGMVAGEAAVCLLLTSTELAEARGHLIHALVRGGASNSNGACSASPSAPNSVMQAEAIVEAWRQSGVAPNEIEFVEGHGSATQVGDSLEIEALERAFGRRSQGAQRCALSSVKANIGHGKSMAGLSSVVKAILSVRRGVLFPAPNVKAPNPVLRKPESPLRVPTDLIRWSSARRIAAVHSFGMSGVNCHIVLENYRPNQEPPEDAGEWFPAPVSGRTPAALRETVAALRRWLDDHGEATPLSGVARTLALGRRHLDCRHLLLAREARGLSRSLADLLIALDHGDAPLKAARAPRIVMLFYQDPESVNCLREMAGRLASSFPEFSRTLVRNPAICGSDGVLAVAFQIALHQLFGAMGITGALASAGVGKLAASALVGAVSQEQAMCDAKVFSADPVQDLDEKVSKLLTNTARSGPVVFISMGAESELSRRIRSRLTGAGAGAGSRVEVLSVNSVESLGEIVGRLFADGLAVRFDPWFAERRTVPVELPGHRFALTRCWLRDTPKRRSPSAHETSDARGREWDRRWVDTPFWERRTAEVWRETLGIDHFTRDDRWFDLGADSLDATRIIRRLNQELGVRCDFEDIFDRPTVSGFADLLRETSGLKGLITALFRNVLKSDAVHEHSDFFALGGHSLLASEILVHVRRELGVSLSFDQFFASPTPSGLAVSIEHHLAAAPASRNGTGEHPSATPGSGLSAESWSAMLRRRGMS